MKKFYTMSARSLVSGSKTAESAIVKGWGNKQSGIVHYVSNREWSYELKELVPTKKRMVFGAGDTGYTDEPTVEVCRSGERFGVNCNNEGWVKIVEGVAVGGSANWETLAKEKRPLWVFK